MEVYVVVVSWQMDSGECGQTVDVYETLEDAKKKLAIEKESAMVGFDGLDLTIYESDMAISIYAVSIYEEEVYCYNHCDITIYQRDILKL